MAPKKDPKKEGPVIEGYDHEAMTREQVEVLAFRLQDEMKREREERAFFQLERDKVRAFWEVARKQLEECQLEVRNKEAGRAEGDSERRKVLKFHDTNIKFLKDEYDKGMDQLKEERKAQLKQAHEEYVTESLRLRKKKMALQEQMREQYENQLEKEKDLHKLQESKVEALVEEQKNEIRELEKHFQSHLADLRKALELKHRVELAECEERHKLQIDTLLRNHAKAMTDLKNYYNEVTLNNLSLVASLKASCAESREGRLRHMQEARALRAENRKLAGPLREAQEHLADMRRRMTNYHKDKLALARAHQRAETAEKRIDALHWQIDGMQAQVDQVNEESYLEKAGHEVFPFPSDTSFSSIAAEEREWREEVSERLQAAQDELLLPEGQREGRRVRELQAQLEQRGAEAEALPPLPEPVCKRVHAVQPLLEEKNRRIASLSLEVARLQRAHETALAQLQSELDRRAAARASARRPQQSAHFAPETPPAHRSGSANAL